MGRMTGFWASGRVGKQEGPSLRPPVCRGDCLFTKGLVSEMSWTVCSTGPIHKVVDAYRSAARNRTEPVREVPDTQHLADGL